MFQRARAFVCHPGLAHRCFAAALLALLVAMIERLAAATAFFDGDWAVWWPTEGIVLAMFLLSGRRAWPWIMLGAATGNLMSPFSDGQTIADFAKNTLCNILEVLIPALMLPRFEDLTQWLQKPHLVRTFVLYALLIGPALGGLIDGVYYHYFLSGGGLNNGVRWAMSDSLGIVMYTSLTLVVISRETYDLFRIKELPGTLGTISLVLATSWFVFHQDSYPIGYVLFPLMLLVATRAGFSGSVLTINLLAPIVASATLHGHGPFSMISGTHEPYRVVTLQVFLILLLLMAFPISVARVQQLSTTAQLQLACERMETLAAEDGLTGLSNRRCFDAALQSEWRRAVRDHLSVALVILDVDNFKAYNDGYGHPAGDTCLQAVAAAVRDVPRRGSDLVARYGGEEFVVLLPGVNDAGAYRVAELLRFAVSELNLAHERSATGRVTISLGCSSMVPSENDRPQTIVERADQALYAAKQGGRNRACLYPAIKNSKEPARLA